MSPTLITALVLDGVCLLLLALAFGRQVLQHVGTYFVAAAVIYHGVTEVLQALDPNRATARFYTTQSAVDDFALLVGASLLVATAVYVAVATHGEPPSPIDHARLRGEVRRALDWRLLVLLCLPLFLTIVSASTVAGALAGLSSQFFFIAAPLVAISFLAKGRRRAFLPVLLLLTIALTLNGQRLEVAGGIVMLLFGLSYLGLRPSARALACAGVVLLLAFAVVNVARYTVGREDLAAGTLSERLGALSVGATAVARGDISTGAESGSIGARTDGNSFGAALMTELANDQPTVGIETTVNNLRLAVPSLLDRGKLQTDTTERSEKLLLNQRYRIGIGTDFLPTQLGVLVAYFGPWGLPVLAGLLGLAYGLVDRLLLRRPGPASLVVGLAAVACAVNYERSMETYPLQARGAVALLLLVAIMRARSSFTVSSLDLLEPPTRGALGLSES